MRSRPSTPSRSSATGRRSAARSHGANLMWRCGAPRTEPSEHPVPLAVDGDLHFEQVLGGTRAPWIVVDPVLLRGDPEYDLGRILWSRLDEITDDAGVLRLFDLFTREANIPRERARQWVILRSTSYLLWGLAPRPHRRSATMPTAPGHLRRIAPRTLMPVR